MDQIFAVFVNTAEGFVQESTWPVLEAAQARANAMATLLPGHPQTAISCFAVAPEYYAAFRQAAKGFDERMANAEEGSKTADTEEEPPPVEPRLLQLH